MTLNGRLVCVGSYTPEMDGRGTGITTFLRDPATGELTPLGGLALPAPSYLHWHPELPVLYATAELPGDGGAVTAIACDEDGTLSVLGGAPTGGGLPCHLTITPDGRHLLSSNYGGGSLAVFRLDERGRIAGRTDLVAHSGSGPDPGRQEGPHVHMVVSSTDGEMVSAVDLGTDEISSYRLSADGRLAPHATSALAPGTGPRQLVRHRQGTRALVAGELGSTLTAVDETEPGVFDVIGVVPATGAGGGNFPAHLEVHGRFAYLSNRGADTIAVFALDGPLPQPAGEYSTMGSWPRHFTVVDRHLYVADQNDDVVVAFTIDAETGGLTMAGRFAAATPTCVVAR